MLAFPPMVTLLYYSFTASVLNLGTKDMDIQKVWEWVHSEKWNKIEGCKRPSKSFTAIPFYLAGLDRFRDTSNLK